jgi:hypothetical protein
MKKGDKAVALNADVHRKLKFASAEQGKPMQRIAEEAIQEKLSKKPKAQ